ncbi:MAG: glutathione binding-like protein [Acidiferrobacterales bacterium]|nr:glutathione binding-like protein [Acidiferrobacterales bacterium]
MYDLYYWTTPNGHKVTMFFEEAGVDYEIIPVNIGKGEQFTADFLQISPNNRIPAMVDNQPADGSEKVSLFESGAMLLYLAEKHGVFIPSGVSGRASVLKWLFWQMANLGPMAGQNHHFVVYLEEENPYAIKRYVGEVSRLYAILDDQLADSEFICGREYTIVDMACYPWIVPHERQRQHLSEFENLSRWFEQIRSRPATVRAYDVAKQVNPSPQKMTEEEKKILFGQDADTLRKLKNN